MRRFASTRIALLIACTLLCSSALKLPANDEKIILTTASGEEKVVTREELEAIESQQRQLHAQVLEKTESEWVEDQSLADVHRSNPQLARAIGVARDSFATLQQHGYARGYKLASFTEVDAVPITSKKAQQEPGFNGVVEQRITMRLYAERDPSSGVEANAGTSAAKRAEPPKLGYEIEALFDKNEVSSVVYAWQLTRDDNRSKELRIKPSEALLKRYAERRQQQAAAGSFVAPYATWLLAGGVSLIVAGVAMTFLAPRRAKPAPKQPAKPATSSTKAPEGGPRKRKDAKAILAQEAGDKWELANGR